MYIQSVLCYTLEYMVFQLFFLLYLTEPEVPFNRWDFFLFCRENEIGYDFFYQI